MSVINKIHINLFQGFHVNEYDFSGWIQNLNSYWGYKWRYDIPPINLFSHLFAIPNNILFQQKFLNSVNYDLLHPTYYRKDLSKYKKNHSIVITVHDMIHDIYPNQFRDSRSLIKQKEESIHHADALICVSENTKNDLIRLYDVPKEKITVIYHGNSLPKSGDFLKKSELEIMYSITRPFILYVGDRKASHKNFSLLLTTFLSRFKDDYNLVCFGGGNFTVNELKYINSHKLHGRITHLEGPDYLLASLYKSAFCFVYPSLYEGFGIPLLEAMGMGCPVVASNTSSIPEVVGNAAILFDPVSSNTLINAIESLSDQEVRLKNINLGFTQESKFSWDITANETYKLYEKVLREKH